MAKSARAWQSRRQLSLVMPAYNEEAGIVQSVTEACEALTDLGYRFEIIVVDDGSSDRTAELVETIASSTRLVRLVRHAHNRGYGAALRTGFENARYDWIGFTDADGQFYLEDLERLMMRTDAVPIVVGRRVNRQDPWQRRFFSWGYNKLVRFLLGTRVSDCDCALKVFHRDVLAQLLPETSGFFVNAEMLSKARRLGLPVFEVDVRHRTRQHGSSKVSLLDIPKTLAKLIPFWWSKVLWAKRPAPLDWHFPYVVDGPHFEVGEKRPKRRKARQPKRSR